MDLRFVLIFICSYLIGSIPFGYLIVSATTGSDVRQTGSGGTGATNVSRRAGKGAGVLTLVLDALKGAGAVLFAKLLLSGSDPSTAVSWIGLAGILAMLGHIFPVWLRFRGGKGVATGIGVFVVLFPLAVIFAGIIFLVVVWLTRYISLGSMLGAVSIPFFVLLLSWFRDVTGKMPLFITALCGAVLIIYAHRENIRRLVNGTENKFK